VKIIYRDDFQKVVAEVMRKNKWTILKQEVFCLTPRRFGKTIAVAMFVAAILWTQPNVEISVFSTGQRASERMMDSIVEVLDCFEGFRTRIVKKVQETVKIRGLTDARDIRRINCYPANPKITPPPPMRQLGGFTRTLARSVARNRASCV
jgi:hypothetical protein